MVVIGTSCSGKTTFARDLAIRLGVDHFELDALHWLPGWVPRDPDDFRTLVMEKAEGAAWVTEGNYKAIRHLLFERASAIIWWVITSFHRRRRDYRALFDGDGVSHAARIELTCPAEAARFLERQFRSNAIGIDALSRCFTPFSYRSDDSI